MKAKTSTMNPSLQPQPQVTNKNTVFVSVAIILFSLLISCGVAITTGAAQFTYDSFVNSLPKFGQYQKMKDSDSFATVSDVLNSQPTISFKNNNAKYLFVEISDLDCSSCANFHGYGTSENTYQKVMEDFVYKGKMDYTFIDKQTLGDIDKHSSAYCVAEQDPEKFFEYKNVIYKNFGTGITLDKAKDYVKQTKQTPLFDMQKFEDCYNSKKYESRVKNLTNFSSNELRVTGTPTFYIYKVEVKEVKKLDGTVSNEKSYTLVSIINGNKDYKLLMKPEIERIVSK